MDEVYRGRAPCPATLWRYDMVRGKVSLVELHGVDVVFTGTLYCDGYWVRCGWRKFIEMQLGRELTNKEWKKLRHKVIYVIATEDILRVVSDEVCAIIDAVKYAFRDLNRMPYWDICTSKRDQKSLRKGFEPDTNNVMEQIFSFINDFVLQIKSFKKRWAMENWAANMFWIWNHRPFNTGPNRGYSPIKLAGGLKPG